MNFDFETKIEKESIYMLGIVLTIVAALIILMVRAGQLSTK